MLRAGLFLGDRYEVIEQIGSGGMADVFKAKDHKLNRFVAVKVMKQEYNEDTTFVSKFRIEAQSAAGLTHPNIVSIYDVGEEEGLYYIVMELVEGITLKRYIEKKGKLTVKEAITIAIQISMGMESAHSNHIIHRDIKPQNIIISKEGKVKVTDFGIAKAATSNTISSSVMGSVHYTSPEQARGGYSNEKSDIYSLGITMYEMLTGKPPFDGDTTVSIAVQHIQEQFPSIKELIPDIPVSVEKIIEKCTMKSPDRRYLDMGELIADLKQSLITPNADFVKEVKFGEGETRKMTQEEVSKIKEKTGGVSVTDEKGKKKEKDQELNPKLEKILTGLGIVAALIVVGIAVYAGVALFKSLGTKSPGANNTAAPTASSSVDENSVVMINVVGKTMEEAKTALNEISLGIKKSGEEYNDDYEKGKIISQDAAVDSTVKKNSTINVVISKGPAALTMPDIAGKTETDARTLIEGMGLEFSVTDHQYNSSVELGSVISATPDVGDEVKKGDQVTVIISRGKEKVVVPDLSNKTEAEASAALSAVGLSLGEVKTSDKYSQTVEAGRVISQDHSNGTSVDAGTKVSIVLSKGIEEVESIWMGTLKIAKSDLPDGFTSGKVRLDLVQVVDGATKTTTVFENTLTSSSFPFSLQITGAESVSSGKVIMYINDVKVDGEHSVVFTEE